MDGLMGFKRKVLWPTTLVISCLLFALSELSAAILSTGSVEPEIDAWDSNTWGIVGNTTEGSITVDGGSRLVSKIAFVNLDFFGVGSATVRGQGSQWLNTDALYIGGSYSGTLNIEAGGYVSTKSGSLAGGAISYGKTIVSGAGSFWDIRESLEVGNHGAGYLVVESGGRVRSGDAVIGRLDFEIGTSRASVSGLGSRWTCRGNLVVGHSAVASLSISDGGLVTVAGTLTIDSDVDGDSFINMSAGGRLALSGRGDATLANFLSLTNGTEVIRYWKDEVGWMALTEATLGLDFRLRYITSGTLSGYTLLTVGQPVPEPNSYYVLLTPLLSLNAMRFRTLTILP